MKSGMMIFLSLFLCTAIWAQDTQPDMQANQFTFSHFKINDNFLLNIAIEAPFDTPCDLDSMGPGERVAYYQGTPCRNQTFPENTTVVMYLQQEAKLTSLTWMIGRYFDERSDFPAKIGMNEEQLIAHLGQVQSTQVYTREGFEAQLLTFQGQIHAYLVKGVVKAFTLGEMPEDRMHSKWRQIVKLLAKFSKE